MFWLENSNKLCYFKAFKTIFRIQFLLIIITLAKASASNKKEPPSDLNAANCGRRLTAEAVSRSRLQQLSLRSDVSRSHEQSSQANSSLLELLYIIGGDEVEVDQFWPWSVAVYEMDPLNLHKDFICSGTLISEQFVLTAAHCIRQSRYDTLVSSDVYLKIAALNLDQTDDEFYSISDIFLHPKYLFNRKINDIALLKLSNNRKLPSKARPICLPPAELANQVNSFTNEPVTIIGWGRRSEPSSSSFDEATAESTTSSSPISLPSADELIDSDDYSDEPDVVSSVASSVLNTMLGINSNYANHIDKLKKTTVRASKSQPNNQNLILLPMLGEPTSSTLIQAQVKVSNLDECNKNYSKLQINWLKIDKHFLCASDPLNHKDACRGDSGGPLMWNYSESSVKSSSSRSYLELDSLKRKLSTSNSIVDEEFDDSKWYQLGLVSFGHGCAKSEYPGVYTSVAYHMPWISETITANSGQ